MPSDCNPAVTRLSMLDVASLVMSLDKSEIQRVAEEIAPLVRSVVGMRRINEQYVYHNM